MANTNSTNETKYIDLIETKKIVIAEIKKAFPGLQFKVKSSRFSMGTSLDFTYTDGPTSKEFDAVTNPFKGSTFDGMQDLSTDLYPMYNGERVHFGAKYISSRREYSNEFLQTVMDYVCAKYWITPVPQMTNNNWSNLYAITIGETYKVTLYDKFTQTLYATSASELEFLKSETIRFQTPVTEETVAEVTPVIEETVAVETPVINPETTRIEFMLITGKFHIIGKSLMHDLETVTPDQTARYAEISELVKGWNRRDSKNANGGLVAYIYEPKTPDSDPAKKIISFKPQEPVKKEVKRIEYLIHSQVFRTTGDSTLDEIETVTPQDKERYTELLKQIDYWNRQTFLTKEGRLVAYCFTPPDESQYLG